MQWYHSKIGSGGRTSRAVKRRVDIHVAKGECWAALTVGKSKLSIRLPELGTNQSHSLAVSYMSVRLLRMCLQYIQGRRCTFYSQCRKYYRSGMKERSYSEYSVGWASLSCRQFLSHQILSCTHTPHLHNHHPLHNQHHRNWKPLSRTCHPQNQHSTCMCVCRFYFFSCAVRQHHHQQSSPPDKFSSRQEGRFAVLGVHLEITSP
ncbi:hypothetical protein PsorP6_000338 [Peronosclerospora sorghi]|uniref:Uncharacterized protein n=1 Tax=Peronosclerospora sorghi TaxID=230839 RepID=A0ACC0WYQ1_9STRA|nr:hypothetical protein PsorP6_018735 [Peronosclerospora sorghi]KAI9922821.1 hypothetical protein PsorP6_000338 [Peronosclerospora sorghi]